MTCTYFCPPNNVTRYLHGRSIPVVFLSSHKGFLKHCTYYYMSCILLLGLVGNLSCGSSSGSWMVGFSYVAQISFDIILIYLIVVCSKFGWFKVLTYPICCQPRPSTVTSLIDCSQPFLFNWAFLFNWDSWCGMYMQINTGTHSMLYAFAVVCWAIDSAIDCTILSYLVSTLCPTKEANPFISILSSLFFVTFVPLQLHYHIVPWTSSWLGQEIL